MQCSFPLFQGHLDLAQSFWKKHLQPGDWAIDATCGKGRDLSLLASLVGLEGGVIGMDIQEQAISATRLLLSKEKAPVHLFCQSHSSFPTLCYLKPIRLIVYNLGYLPGGNKKITTQVKTTVTSVQSGMELLQPNGVLSITCYPGHPEGAKEELALLEMASLLDSRLWSCSHHTWKNRQHSPSLLLIQKL